MTTTDPTNLPNTPKKRAFKYDENVQSTKKIRSSLANTLKIVHSDLICEPLPIAGLSAGCAQEITDRFVADPGGHTLPMFATPRSRRFAQSFGVTEVRQLVFHDSKNKARPKQMCSFRKCLTKNLYDAPLPLSSASAATNLNTIAELVLNAPNVADDFYSRPISWNPAGVLAVATQYSVNYRNMHTGAIGSFCRALARDIPACVEWSPSSTTLAFSEEGGDVLMLDVRTEMVMRRLRGYDVVGGMSWAGAHMLSVGYNDGRIRHYDMRMERPAKVVQAHSARTCGVKWSPDQQFLASGGGEGAVQCWDARASKELELPGDRASSLTRQWRKKRHTSTVKAIAWCPWQPDILATGGGTRDGSIRVWSTSTGTQLHVVPTLSQISSLHFAPHCKELVSTHGFAYDPRTHSSVPRAHSILVHAYPTFHRTGKILDSTHGRISDSCLSPDGMKLVTCGGDETIKLYKVFGPQKKMEKEPDGMRNQNAIR